MRKTLALALLAACSHPHAQPTETHAETPKAEPPPGALVVDGEDGAQGRQTFAVGFLGAIAHRDDALIAAYLDAPGFCAAMIEGHQVKDPAMTQATCESEMSKDNAEAMTMMRDAIPETFEPGEITEYPIDEKQGIYLVNVMTKGSTADEDLKGVMLIEFAGHRYAVFPRKK